VTRRIRYEIEPMTLGNMRKLSRWRKSNRQFFG
jgi:hypothetical protein